GRVYVGADDAMVHCVGADDGRVLWRGDVAAGMWASPTVVDGLVVIGDWNGVLNALDADTGRSVWTVETGTYIVSSACVAGGRIYIGSRNGTFYCFEDAAEVTP
ncbi:MAG: PQQ-binding-like beta-propeller repeat protein, partial [Myxococcota bacterium]|nr:PQQ-binding-like beta-propeller repeat protein [Myxococcota bacterium]